MAEALFKTITEQREDSRGVRRPKKLSEIAAVADCSTEELVEVIDVFRRADRSFLMPPIDRELNPDDLIDISHESLMRNWGRLRDWVEEEAEDAKLYRRFRESLEFDTMLTGVELETAIQWQDRKKTDRVLGRALRRSHATCLRLD